MTAVLDADLLAEALFASSLQPSDQPSSRRVWNTVHTTVDQIGGQGCTDRVAQEFGDHPEAACERMCWCRRAVVDAFALTS